MAEPIDINKNKKDAERTQDLKDALYIIYVRLVDSQNKLNMRIEDLAKDCADLTIELDHVIATLYEKYPELQPELPDDEEDLNEE